MGIEWDRELAGHRGREAWRRELEEEGECGRAGSERNAEARIDGVWVVRMTRRAVLMARLVGGRERRGWIPKSELVGHGPDGAGGLRVRIPLWLARRTGLWKE